MESNLINENDTKAHWFNVHGSRDLAREILEVGGYEQNEVIQRWNNGEPANLNDVIALGKLLVSKESEPLRYLGINVMYEAKLAIPKLLEEIENKPNQHQIQELEDKDRDVSEEITKQETILGAYTYERPENARNNRLKELIEKFQSFGKEPSALEAS